nr:integrase, catalytic region, zinc finger, CCHC-type, peptidase aspartic, catalytic [Tanacetum cinerariifolium]
KFVRDFKSLAKEVDESLAKHKALELEIKRLLRAVASHDIMSVVQNNSVYKTSNVQTELEHTKERFENCIIKKDNEYAKLWNDWYKKCEECKFDKFSYDKAYNDMQQKIERLQAQLGDLKGKSKDTSCVSDTLNPLSQKLKNENVKLEFQTTLRPRPQPRSNTKNDKVPFASKSSQSKNKGFEVEEHHRKLLLSRNNKHMSSECNKVKLATQNVKSKVVCAMCNPNMFMVRRLGLFQAYDRKSTASHKFCWKFLGSVRFRNDYIAVTLGFGDLQWGNILITRVYFVKGLGHNLFLIRQFCDSDLEVAFRRNACFVRNLGVDLLKGNRSTNLYTINLHEMASVSLICLVDHASSTKSLLWHQRLSHLNFDTINDLAKNDLVSGLLKFNYHKEHLCPSCEQGKSKRTCHPPKPVPNSRQRLHLLHMDLCGPMRIASINEKRYVLVIVDDYSRYTWQLLLHVSLKTAPSFTINLTKHHTSSLTAENWMSLSFMYSGLSVIPRIIVNHHLHNMSSNMHKFYQPYPHEFQWTKDHPLEQVIEEPSWPVLTRNQLRSDGDMCMYALTVSIMKPKNVKEAMTDPLWIESMQEELL